MTAADGQPAARAVSAAAEGTTGEALAAKLAGCLAAHHLVYPEAAEALDSLAVDLASLLGLTGADRDAVVTVSPGQAAAGGQEAATRVLPTQAAPAARRPPPARRRVQGAAAALAEQVAGPEGHLCLGCGCTIIEGLREVRVPGRGRRRARYRHADSDDCAAALRAPQPNSARIGTYRPTAGFAWGADRVGPQPVRAVR